MNLPRIPAPGEPLRASWGAEVVAYLRSLTPGLFHHGVTVSRTANGTQYKVQKPINWGAAATSPIYTPLYLVVATDDNGPQIQVIYGTIASLSDNLVTGVDYADNPLNMADNATSFRLEAIGGGGDQGWIMCQVSLTTDSPPTPIGAVLSSTLTDPGTIAQTNTLATISLGGYLLTDDATGVQSITSSVSGSLGLAVQRDWFSSPVAYDMIFFGL